MVIPDDKTLHRIIHRGVNEIIVESEFLQRLRDGTPMRLKMGFDPSRPSIHMGHVVGLRKLRQLQELGHQVILIVGDWTARIGDPSGVSATRPMLTAEEVHANAITYMDQFFRVVDKDMTQTMWQSEWFGSFTLDEVFTLTTRFTIAQFLARDDFAKRYQSGRPIAVTELLYPLLQAYDSVAVNADVEFGGTDQKFNLLVGRELQEKMGKRPQQCFLMPILPGTDGVRKMSKSLDNYITVEEPATSMFGKIMSIPDGLILQYFELLTDVDDAKLSEIRSQLAGHSVNPMDLKKHLGREIVAQFHSATAAREAESNFEQVYQRKKSPEEMQTVSISDPVTINAPEGQGAPHHGKSLTMTRWLAEKGLVSSRSEAKRLLSQGAIEIDGQRVTNDKIFVCIGAVLRVGRHTFVRIVNE